MSDQMILPEGFDARVAQAVGRPKAPQPTSDEALVAAQDAAKQLRTSLKSRTAGVAEAGEDARTLTRSGSKSGYARDKFKDRLEGDEASGGATPIADSTGIQEGRLPPALRKGAAHYEAVTAAEADRRRIDRMRGTVPVIAGGIDDPVPRAAVPQITGEEQFDDSRMDMGASPNSPVPVSSDKQLFTTAQKQATAANQLSPMGAPDQWNGSVQQAAFQQNQQLLVKPSATDKYLTKRVRVQFTVDGGTYSVPAVDVKVSNSTVTILLPCSPNDATFIPKPGARLTVGLGDKQWPCYFPGTACELTELGLMALMLMVDHETGPADKRDSAASR